MGAHSRNCLDSGKVVVVLVISTASVNAVLLSLFQLLTILYYKTAIISF